VLIHGDCVEVMAGMDPESVDAIVTDPPYGLEFMGKEWGRLGGHGQVKHTGPADVADGERGQYGKVSYFGSANRKCRTCNHWEWSRTPCKCETPDFPNRNHRQGELMQQWHQQWAEAAYRVAKPSAYLLAFGGTRTVHRMTVALEDAGWIIRDMLVWGYASGFPKSKASLKPAWEPIVMARKPGPLRMLAIDECRLPTTDTYSYPNGPAGRWPANIVLTDPIFDGGVEGVVGGGETGRTPGSYDYSTGDTGNPRIYGDGEGIPKMDRREGFGDSGTYSRFFLIPKAARADREPVLTPDWFEGTGRVSTHPTVKPTALMRHLVRLVTPAGGTVLDPFLGSGTTALAAEMEGFEWIGIEREAEYVAIAEARLNGTQRGLGLEAS
jgi:DNA modification methylase